MGAVAELRILTGCHAGARVAVAGGERLGSQDACDLILTDLGLSAGAAAWLQIASERWGVTSDPDTGSHWVAEQIWGTVAYLGQVAMTVSLPHVPWQSVPPGLGPAGGTPLLVEAPPVVAPEPEEDSPQALAAGAPQEEQASAPVAVDPRLPSAAPRRWQPAWIIGAALAALLLSVFWSLLQRQGSAQPPAAAAFVAAPEAGPAQQQRLLRDIQLAIARVDPALRLRVEALPEGGARVSGWVADIAHLDRLADGLAEIRPVPALSVRTASDLIDDLVDAGGADAPALRFELLGEGRVRALGLVAATVQHQTLELAHQERELVETAYLHMNTIVVKVRQKVHKGELLGTVGNTGISTACHLHFSVYVNGKAVISALTTAGQVLRCTVTVTSEIGRVQMSKNAMLLQAVGASQKLTAQAAGTKNGTMTWISSNPGVATVSADGMVTAVGDGETMILAVTPEGRADACYVAVGAAAWRFRSEDELAETLTLTGQLPYSDGK